MSARLPQITPDLIEEANRIFEDLMVLGWSKNKVERELSWPSGEFSRLTLGHCSLPIAEKRLPQLRAFHEEAPIAKQPEPEQLGPDLEMNEELYAPATAMRLRRPVSDGVFDDLVYAEKCRKELEEALVRVESKCLPILRLGVRSAINKIRDFRDDIRVG